jgi:fluoride exporter
VLGGCSVGVLHWETREESDVNKFLLIGAGGFIGAVARYGVGGAIQEWSGSIDFPYGTLAVNVAGCLLIGLLSQLSELRGVLSPETRFFIFIGFLGAFTTFSTFGNETLGLLSGEKNLLAFLNMGLHMVLGLGAVWIGQALACQIWR